MDLDIYTICELCGISILVFFLIGMLVLWAAARMGRREFRSKGYLRPPSGKAWIRFLLRQHYDSFENPNTRYLFDIARFCLMVVIFVTGALLILILCALLLYNVATGH
jgi:hypothetical protein